MTTVFIILAIIWIIVPIALKKQQQKAKTEQEAQRAARQRAAQPAAQPRPQQPLRTTPLAPTVRPSAAFQPSFEGIGSQEGQPGAVFEGEQAHEVATNLTRAQSTLKEAKTSITHTVTVSSESGHAHEETSATGIAAQCPPEKAPAKPAPQPSLQAAADDSAFSWDVAQARSGLVMAEILGPCLALRD